MPKATAADERLLKYKSETEEARVAVAQLLRDLAELVVRVDSIAALARSPAEGHG